MLESKEYIDEYGRTHDEVLGIVMFWCVTSFNKNKYNLDYFNEKMYRYLNHVSTQKEMDEYKRRLTSSIMDDNNDIGTIEKVIDIIVDIYGDGNIDYQLHMYGPSEDGSGDYWLNNKDEIMSQMGTDRDLFSIIGSSNGVSLIICGKMNFLSIEDWKKLYKYYNRTYKVKKLLS